MSADTSGRTSAGGFEIVALGSSAGGIRALAEVLGGLATDLPVPVLMVQHLDPRHDTLLAELLGRRTGLRVKLAVNGETSAAGVVYVAPPNFHLLVDTGGVLSLSRRDPVRFLRPSVDLLFESVAQVYGAAALVCVLTGTGQDGAAGVRAVKDRGGTVLAQDPTTANFGGMPQAAVGTGRVDYVVALDRIAPLICELVGGGRHER